MPIDYQVVPNSVKKDHYRPKVVVKQEVGLSQLVEDIAYETSLTPTEIYGVLDALIRRIKYYLQYGYRVKVDGLATFYISLHEDLKKATDRISEVVKVRVKAKASTGLWRRLVKGLKFRYVILPDRVPTVAILFDGNTKHNQVYTAGNVAKLIGRDLKFDVNADDEGVFFISVADGIETQVTSYIQTTDRRIGFLIPPSLQGEQYVVVRTRYGGNLLREGQCGERILPTI